MATSNLSLVITAKDEATAKLRNVSNSVSKLSGSSGFGMLSKTAEIAAKSVAIFGTALTVAGGFAVKSASNFEQQRVSFENMLGSAEKARNMLKQLSDFAAKTPFQLPEIVNAGKQLLSYGVSAEEVLSKMTLLGDAAAKMSVPIEDSVAVWAKAKAGLFETEQFARLGVTREALEKVGLEFKKSGELADRSKLAPAIEKLFGQSAGLMEKQSKTFAGIMSNITDNIGRMARTLIGISEEGDIREGSIFFYLKKGSEELYNFLEKNKETITRTINEKISQAIEKIKEWIEQMGGREGIKQKILEFYSVLVDKVIPSIYWLIVKIKDIIIALYEHRDAVMFVIAAWGLFKILTIASNLIGLFNALGLTTGAVKLLKLALTNIPLSLVITIGISSIIAAVKEAYKLKDAMDSLSNSLNKSISDSNKRLQSIKKDDPNREKKIKAEQKHWETQANIYENLAKSLSISSLLFGKAMGGSVSAGSSYIVGEHRPEVFVPSQSGNIRQIEQIGGQEINVNFNNVSVRSDFDLDQIIRAVKDTLSRDQQMSSYGIRTI